MRKKYTLGTGSEGVPVEIEGGEYLQFPNGTAQMVQGPSHEQGGIDTTLPEGTIIGSKDITIKGYTIAERMNSRGERYEEVVDNFKKNPNTFSKNTAMRTIAFLKALEEHDLKVQEMIKGMQKYAQTERQYAQYGTGGDGLLKDEPYVDDIPFDTYPIAEGALVSNYYNQGLRSFAQKYLPKYQTGTDIGELPNPETVTQPTHALKGLQLEGALTDPMDNLPTSTWTETDLDNAVAGDSSLPESGGGSGGGSQVPWGNYVGLAAQAIGGVEQLINTYQAAKANRPVVNYWMGVNRRALEENSKAIDETAYLKNVSQREMERKLNISANTARERARKSASSINSLRALDLGTDIVTNEAKISSNNQLESTFGSQRLNLIGQRMGLLSEQDKLERAGAEKNDEIIEARSDNFYTNRGQNLATMTEGFMNVAKMMNESKQNNDFLNTLKDTNKWGVGYRKTSNGYELYAPKSSEGFDMFSSSELPDLPEGWEYDAFNRPVKK